MPSLLFVKRCCRGALRLGLLAALAAGLVGTSVAQPVDTSAVPFQPVPSALAEGWQQGAFVEIFVRGYKDSNGDGVGDLRGLTQSLDYLRDLGIKGIWLMPITASADHDHGYATQDFRQLEAAYGSLQDLDELLKQAHARGIGVIMDYVVNHSASDHPLFAQSASAPDNPYRDWYVWQPQAPTGWDIWGKNPWFSTANGAYFGTFGAHMPDFNLRNPRVVAYHEDSLRFWLNRGLDGFRLDAVPHLIENSATEWNDQPESRQLTHRLRELIARYPRRHVVCEATANPMAYAADDVCGSAFGFGHEHNIVRAARGEPDAIEAVAQYFLTAPLGMATMVSNHDIFAGERLWDQLNGNEAQYRLAAATYLLQPGTPFIYYGEEIGMAGVKGLPGDMPLRSPMSWRADARGGGFTEGGVAPFRPVSPNNATHNVAAEQADPKSLLAFYQAMLKLRNSYPSLARGSYEAPFVQGRLMGYQRRFQGEHSVVLVNYGQQPVNTTVDGLPAGSTWAAAYPQAVQARTVDAQGHLAVTLAPQSVAVYVFPAR
jgi:glycosidase